jgi:tetratricopeptide (TPR) repeat protein
MSQVAKLKKQAAEFELKKQFDKALPIYVKLLDLYDQHSSEIDVALFNRVGDLMLRQGNVADAVDYYEKAVDRYAETGFFNNAIALCNKVLRQSPGRTSIYYKLGRISAQKGFNAEARANFLEYSDRMRKAGNHDEAFARWRSSPTSRPSSTKFGQMLADQLIKAGRKDEAIEQLQLLHERYDGDGRDSDAKGVAARLHSLDPNATPRASAGRKQRASSDLIFIDLDEPTAPTPVRVERAAPPPPAAPAKGHAGTAASAASAASAGRHGRVDQRDGRLGVAVDRAGWARGESRRIDRRRANPRRAHDRRADVRSSR